LSGLDITAPPQSNDRQAVHPNGNSISFAMVVKAFANLLGVRATVDRGREKKGEHLRGAAFFAG
jgi:hypothetical protein